MPIQPQAPCAEAGNVQRSAPATPQSLVAVQARLQDLLNQYQLSLTDRHTLPGNLQFHFGIVVDETSACIALRQQVEHIEDALCAYPLADNPVLQTAVTLFTLFGLEKLPDGSSLILEYLQSRLAAAQQKLQEREKWLAEAIDELCIEVKAMHSELHAARQAAAAVDADMPQEGHMSSAPTAEPAVGPAGLEWRADVAGHDAGAPAPLDALTATEVAVVGSVPTLP